MPSRPRMQKGRIQSRFGQVEHGDARHGNSPKEIPINRTTWNHKFNCTLRKDFCYSGNIN